MELRHLRSILYNFDIGLGLLKPGHGLIIGMVYFDRRGHSTAFDQGQEVYLLASKICTRFNVYA